MCTEVAGRSEIIQSDQILDRTKRQTYTVQVNRRLSPQQVFDSIVPKPIVPLGFRGDSLLTLPGRGDELVVWRMMPLKRAIYTQHVESVLSSVGLKVDIAAQIQFNREQYNKRIGQPNALSWRGPGNQFHTLMFRFSIFFHDFVAEGKLGGEIIPAGTWIGGSC